jgi:large subunit ribosomal protein L21
MYAVIKTGGKQYKVEAGQVLDIELLGEEVGANVTFTPVLVVDGDRVVANKAALASAKVTAEIVGSTKGPKITGYMYKSKARAQRKWGHRQKYATIKVTAVTA